MVELELIGIPADCAKHKSKMIQRNALNPIWNEVYQFQVQCHTLIESVSFVSLFICQFLCKLFQRNTGLFLPR